MLYTTTSWINTPPYYVATQDCIAKVDYTVYNVHLTVDGVDLCQSNANASSTGTFWAPVKKGQTLRVYQTGNHSGTSGATTVYGLK